MLIVVSALLLSGCHLVTGGGWIASIVAGKATFGFTARCVFEEDFFGPPGHYFYVGQFQYADKAAGVRFHAELQPTLGVLNADSCRDAADILGGDPEMSGTYRQQPGGGTGVVDITVQDFGEPGSASGDTLCVTLTGGPLDGYHNCGIIQGGNIKVH